MGNYEQAVVIGSGTVPHLTHGPAHNIPQGTFPIPDQRTDLRNRRAEGVALLNPEDLSVNIGIRSQAVDVETSATPLPLNPLEYRRALVVHNNGASTVYLGDSSVTVNSGMPLLAGEKIAFDIQGNPNVTVYAIASATVEVRVMELA